MLANFQDSTKRMLCLSENSRPRQRGLVILLIANINDGGCNQRMVSSSFFAFSLLDLGMRICKAEIQPRKTNLYRSYSATHKIRKAPWLLPNRNFFYGVLSSTNSVVYLLGVKLSPGLKIKFHSISYLAATNSSGLRPKERIIFNILSSVNSSNR